ncbi:MAG TPA: hypothetical protein VIV07_09130 [Sphingomicrobium sp.]
MKRLAFVVASAAALTLAGCSGSNQDQVNNAELNQPEADLNALSNQAAMDAANAEAANMAAQANQNAAAENTANPKEADEQNVSGM